MAGALVLVGFVVRARGLSEYWLNPDEGIYYSTLTQGSFGQFWSEVVENAHPPGFYLLLRLVGYLTWDFVLLRLPSAIFGSLAIWAMWLLGRELGGEGRAGVAAGLATAALFAFDGAAIVRAQVIRPYSFLVAFEALALVCLLRFRREPTRMHATLYAAFAVLAMTMHYGGMLAWGVFVALGLWDAVRGHLGREEIRRLGAANLAPALVFCVLLGMHLLSTLASPLMEDALGSGGWLSAQLVDSPAAAWGNFVQYQLFHVPPALIGRGALVVLAGMAWAAWRGPDRTILVLSGVALGGALLASALDLYPFGPTRHSMWLVPFTLPLFGWVAGRIAAQEPSRAWGAGAVLVFALVLGVPAEHLRVGPASVHAAEEQVVKPADIAQLVVGWLDPQGQPEVILMSQQPYYLFMPLYADQRGSIRRAEDGSAFSFAYGSRRIVVAERWDWGRYPEMRETIRALPRAVPWAFSAETSRALILAGGFGTVMTAYVPEMRRRGLVLGEHGAIGETATGQPIWRVSAVLVDPSQLPEAL